MTPFQSIRQVFLGSSKKSRRRAPGLAFESLGQDFLEQRTALTANSPGREMQAAALITAPGVPTNPQATANTTTLTLSWASPSTNGGASISEYSMQLSTDGGSTWVTSRLLSASPLRRITNAVAGTSYTFRVAAKNSAGLSDYSAWSNAVVAYGNPGSPTSVSGTPGDGSVTLSWTTPAANGSPITDYLVTLVDGTAPPSWRSSNFPHTPSPATSITVTGLANGTGYTFVVSAINAAGYGPRSARSAVLTPVAAATVPGMPTALAGVGADGSVALSWNAPASAGGAPITDYTIQYSGDNGTSWTTFSRAASTSTTATVTGVTNGTSYVFRVAAVNSVGVGSFTAASATVVPTAGVSPPTAPSGVSAVPGNASLNVTWTASSNASAETTYLVQYSTDSGNTWSAGATVTGTTTSTILTGLRNNVSYWIRVAATNAAGTNLSSMSVPSIPVAAPSANALWYNASKDYSIAIWTAVDQYGVGKGQPVVLKPGQSAWPMASTAGSRTLYVAIAPVRNLSSGWYTVVDPNLRVTFADSRQVTFWVDGWVAGAWQIRVNNVRSAAMYR